MSYCRQKPAEKYLPTFLAFLGQLFPDSPLKLHLIHILSVMVYKTKNEKVPSTSRACATFLKSENLWRIPLLKATKGFCSGQAIHVKDVVLPDKSDIYLINLTDTTILWSSLHSSEHLAMVFALPRLLKFPYMMCSHQFYSCDGNPQKGRREENIWRLLVFSL